MTKKTRYELLFSDIEMGHRDLGWLPRLFKNADDEDLNYERFLNRKGIKARVVEGVAYVESESP